MKNANKFGNISNLIPSPSSYQYRKTTVNMEVSGFCYDMHFRYYSNWHAFLIDLL